MNPSDEQDPLRGLTRSIEELFSVDDESVDDEPEESSRDEPAPPRRQAPKAVSGADPLMDMEVVPLDETDETDEPVEPRDPADLLDDSVVAIDLGEEGRPAPAELTQAAELAAGPLDGTPEPAVPEPPAAEAAPEPAPPAQPEPSDEAFAEFDGPAGAVPPPDAGPGGDEPALAGAALNEPSDPGEALSMVVERYLAAGGSRRDELSRRIRELAGTLRDANRTEPIADAVERLVVAGRRHGDQEAPQSLARMVTAPAVAVILTVRLGSTRDEERRRQLVEVGAAVGDEMAHAVGEALSATDDRSARRAYMDALVAMGDAASPVVAGMIEDSRWFVVRNAVLLLGEMAGETSVHHLTRTLAHDDPRVRRETVLALAKIGGADAAALVQNKLDDPDVQVRVATARAIGELRIERAVRLVLSRLDEETDPEAQVALIRALGQIGDPGAVPALEKRAVGGFFSKPSVEIRISAYRAMAAIGTPHARQLLEQAAAGDADPAVKAAAAAALGRSSRG